MKSRFKLLLGLSVLFLSSFLFTVRSHAAQSKEEDFSIVNGVLFSYKGTASDVIVPEGVLRIYGNAFSDTPAVNIILPESLTVISTDAFKSCRTLESINIPSGCRKIGANAFRECNNLEFILLPKGMKIIGDGAFQGCSSLNSINLESVTEIGQYAFSECYNLEEVTLSKELTKINKNVFEECITLSEVNLSDSITCISDYAFSGCIKLNSIILPDGVRILGDCVFNGCSDLTTIQMSKNLQKIGHNPFMNTPWFDNYPEEMLIINHILVSYDGNAGSVVVPDGITGISSYAFENSTVLNDISIPDSVLYIGNGILYQTEWEKQQLQDWVILNGFLLKYQGKDSVVTIPDQVKYICPYAFSSAAIREIVISEGVVSIGDHAFDGCTNLTDVSISDTVTQIGDYAFTHCQSLIRITLPDSVTNIGDYLFYADTNLKYIKYPKKVDSIGKISVNFFNSSYMECALSEIILPEGLQTIEEGCFYSNEYLKSIVLPSSVTSIGDRAFESCKNLKSVTLSANLTSIGDYAFSITPVLKKLIIPKKVEQLGDYTFMSSFNHITVTFLNRKTDFGENAFLYIEPYIMGYHGSTAEEFAIENNLNFTEYAAIKISKDHLKLLIGESNTISMLGTTGTVSWKSSNSKVATVKNGKITAVNYGTATITATVNKKSYTCTITVPKPYISSAAFRLKTGHTVILSVYHVTSAVTWSSSNKAVATVDRDGIVKALKSGKVIITATVNGQTYTCTVTVTK